MIIGGHSVHAMPPYYLLLECFTTAISCDAFGIQTRSRTLSPLPSSKSSPPKALSPVKHSLYYKVIIAPLCYLHQAQSLLQA